MHPRRPTQAGKLSVRYSGNKRPSLSALKHQPSKALVGFFTGAVPPCVCADTLVCCGRRYRVEILFSRGDLSDRVRLRGFGLSIERDRDGARHSRTAVTDGTRRAACLLFCCLMLRCYVLYILRSGKAPYADAAGCDGSTACGRSDPLALPQVGRLTELHRCMFAPIVA